MLSQARGEVLQFPQLHQVPTNISSTKIRGTHGVLLIKYLEVGDDKQLGHTAPKPCKGPHIKGLACHGHQTDAPLHRRHLKIHMIPICKLQRPSSLVRISFLSALSCLQMTLNNTDLLSSFFDEIRPKISMVSHFNPVKWCPTFLSIQSFKWCHTNAFLIAIVVKKLS